jgi:transposase
MSAKFIDYDQNTLYLLPPSLQDWLPEDHLARFVVEIVDQLDLSSLKAAYAGRGSQPYNPEMLLALLFYGYATGVFSSRKLERSTYDSVAFRFIAANAHPDHDTIAAFRKRFLPQLKPLFVRILLIAQQTGVLKLGTVSLDGTKVKANASKHKALSYAHACKLEEQLKAEVAELLRQAEAADQAYLPEGMNIPEELSRRTERLKAIAEAKAEIERRAAERYAQEKEAYDKNLAERAEKEKKTGKKPGGPKPQPPTPGVKGKDQVNLTDGESRIMKKSGGGFEQAYNAQAGVDTESMMIVTSHVSQQTNDKRELEPAVVNLAALPEALGTVDALLGDNGFYSEVNVGLCEQYKIKPYLAFGREQHNQPLMDRFRDPSPVPDDADAVTRMKYSLRTQAGRKLYAKRKSTVEPVFGIIKAVMGFRQFLLRGFESVQGEWDLVCIAWNLKRLHALS